MLLLLVFLVAGALAPLSPSQSDPRNAPTHVKPLGETSQCMHSGGLTGWGKHFLSSCVPGHSVVHPRFLLPLFTCCLSQRRVFETPQGIHDCTWSESNEHQVTTAAS